MKSLILLLVFTSLAYAKPTSENDFCGACKSLVDDFYKYLETQLDQAKQQAEQMCSFLPADKKQECIDAIVKQIDEGFEQMKTELSPQIVCEALHLCKPQTLLSISGPKETIAFNFPRIFQNFGSIWDKISCSQCQIYHNFLHQAFKNPDFKQRYLNLGEKLCPDKECVKKLKALVESISKYTDAEKACKPVCNV